MQSAPLVSSIEYRPSSSDWFELFRDQPFAIWLDSAQSQYGRWDILSAAPHKWLETINKTTRIYSKDSGADPLSATDENPFDCLKQVLGDATSLTDFTSTNEIPFCGGAIGYFGYEIGNLIEPRLASLRESTSQLPDMLIGIYAWAILQDHHKKQAWLVVNPSLAPNYDFSRIKNQCLNKKFNSDSVRNQNRFAISRFNLNLPAQKYAKQFEKIKEYINAGDVYQVNFAQRFSANYWGDSFTAYLRLREALPSPFSAFMTMANGRRIMSLSPERFIKLENNVAETQPIKGTLSRGRTTAEDILQAQILQASEKDRAENLMIVDLLRNDLSRTCVNIKVPKLFELQSFTNVHHLVSTITGELRPGKTSVDLLANAFPGGSITGAPKIRAMEIISELEAEPRSLYCGSLGYISVSGKMDTNIAIRTLVCDSEKIYCWGGGGIVADSVCADEYQESIAKVKILMDTLEQNFFDAVEN